MSVHIFENADALASGAAAYVASVIADAGRPITLGLAGGSTPAATYRKLARADVEWDNVVMWLGDERWVPADHQESNARMAREMLTDQVGAELLTPKTGAGDPHTAASDYSSTLQGVFFGERPDLVLLGIGDDGHTASLFPGTEALGVDESAYLANWVEHKATWRLTASMTLLHSARELVFLVQGEAKAGVLAQIIDDGHPYPAQQVAEGADTVRWMVDREAAARLRSIPR